MYYQTTGLFSSHSPQNSSSVFHRAIAQQYLSTHFSQRTEHSEAEKQAPQVQGLQPHPPLPLGQEDFHTEVTQLLAEQNKASPFGFPQCSTMPSRAYLTRTPKRAPTRITLPKQTDTTQLIDMHLFQASCYLQARCNSIYSHSCTALPSFPENNTEWL